MHGLVGGGGQNIGYNIILNCCIYHLVQYPINCLDDQWVFIYLPLLSSWNFMITNIFDVPTDTAVVLKEPPGESTLRLYIWPHSGMMPDLMECINPVGSAWCLNASVASYSQYVWALCHAQNPLGPYGVSFTLIPSWVELVFSQNTFGTLWHYYVKRSIVIQHTICGHYGWMCRRVMHLSIEGAL